MNVLSQWILTAGELFDSIILHNDIPITDMPPAHQTALHTLKDEEVLKMWLDMKTKILCASFKEMESCLDLYSIPPKDDLIGCNRDTPLVWDPVLNFKKHPDQSTTSFEEQKMAVKNIVSAIDKYNDYTGQVGFVKCRVIAGSPGSGKSFILNYTALYAISKGLKVAMTSLMARCSVHLGGIHIHKLFQLPVQANLNLHRVAELSLQALLRYPVTLNMLKMIDIIFLDEVGQVSCELMTCLDLILRRIRNNNIFLGGLLFICTLDHKQFQPINGKPFLVSPMVLSCFEFICISESVRANNDPNLQRIQNITRMNPKEYDENPQIISEFKSLLSSTCTFVNNWNDPIITPTTYRLYGKKYPAQQVSKIYIDQVKCQLRPHEMRVRISVDCQTPDLSHHEWQVATEFTTTTLDQRCKEPRELLF